MGKILLKPMLTRLFKLLSEHKCKTKLCKHAVTPDSYTADGQVPYKLARQNKEVVFKSNW